MRPRYETAGDLSREEKLIALVAETFDLEYRKLPVSYGLDFMMMRSGRVSSFVECKVRTNPVKQYPTIMVSLLKVMKARELSAAAGVSALFLVSWKDATGYFDLTSPDWVGWGGRADRGDPADMEPVAHFDIDNVKEISCQPK